MSRFAIEVRTDGARRFPARPARCEAPNTVSPLSISDSGIQRKAACPCGGGCPSCQAKSNDLKISQPNDPAEIQADRIADQVMSASGHSQAHAALPHNHRFSDQSEGQMDVTPANVGQVLAGGGRPLDQSLQRDMEQRFGHDFSRVQVHTDAAAEQSARDLNAHAYTAGHNIVFGAGQYMPSMDAGRRLLAHELTHVVQQSNASPFAQHRLDSGVEHGRELAARNAESPTIGNLQISRLNAADTSSGLVQRSVVREHVSCQQNGLTNPNLTGDEVVAALEAADAEAIRLALRAELLLEAHLLFARAGEPVDPDFDVILQEELGLTLTNRAHFSLVEQQRDRFRRVRETLESGYLRYICRGGTVSLVGCATGTCGADFAFSCPGNRLVVLCQAFWDDPTEQAGTILHEPFHIWFHMARHAPNALRRADATCFEAFARRLAGEDVAHISCAGHTAG